MQKTPMTYEAIDRDAIRAATHPHEAQAVRQLLIHAKGILPNEARGQTVDRARRLVERCRGASDPSGTLDAFLREFGLSNREGVALMCLAEALLRIPDEDTADRLIAETIRAGDWRAHAGRSRSGFVNASVWGLMLTGRLVALDPAVLNDTDAWMRRLVSRVGEPVVRTAVLQAMRIMGGQYVLGRTIDEALERGRELNDPGTRFSFDMLGEGARTYEDADRYFNAYADAIDRIGRHEVEDDPIRANGLSVKLSALHPRYQSTQHDRVITQLLPRLRQLAGKARHQGLGMSIDAEECARLDLSLALFEALATDPGLRGWQGLGFVLQAYQKRAVGVADWLIELGRRTERRLMVRLVKGAYWDAEIKQAQTQGFADYPVFTRKAHTDLSYEVCAARLLSAPEAIYPQFATHNAHTVSIVLALAGHRRDFEFQRLHGMGHLLYQVLSDEQTTDVLSEADPEPCALRVYAPVGSHRDLLPYLVRRLLENGANSSFVNRFLDARTPVNELVRDAIDRIDLRRHPRHSRIPTPGRLYRHSGEARDNSRGIDLDNPLERAALLTEISEAPISLPIPAEATDADIERALASAFSAQPAWNRLGGPARARILEQASQLLESRRAGFVALIVREGKRTLADSLAEVREAVDFCRYYAAQARLRFAQAEALPGPAGERNELHLDGRGTFACISPWNFPLAIFMGQVSAALAAGNAVIAKPAEQTPRIAAEASRLLIEAGVPAEVLQLLTGDGARIGKRLLTDARLHGVAFTGSTGVAKIIQRTLTARDGPIIPLIAETGGVNVMLVDSTALPEQVVDDVITSAFRSAGQRCSALRVLYLQEEIAEPVLTMLAGAMQTLTIGDPLDPATDIGPVIDREAQLALQAHLDHLHRTAQAIAACTLPDDLSDDTFFAPCAFEIRSLSELPGEVFGPILHVIRYQSRSLPQVLDDIRTSGYGLTLGVHSRIDGFVQEVFEQTRVGNTYVNRNMIGAVVGVNPFGGLGLSGTGPKAGGPNYLTAFASERTFTENLAAKGGNTELFGLAD